MNYTFLDEKEKENFFFNVSKVDHKDYPVMLKVKIYENMELMIYTYDYAHELKIIGMLKVISFNMGSSGLYTTVLDKKTYRAINVGCVPKEIGSYSVVLSLPPLVPLERTIKQKPEGGAALIHGNTAVMNVRLKSHPNRKFVYEHYTVPVKDAAHVLGSAEVNEAYRRLEDGEH